MSQSTPVCYLFCSRCKKESRNSITHYDRDHVRFYLDIKVLGPLGDGALCKCQRCGHSYVSKSMAAKRALRGFK